MEVPKKQNSNDNTKQGFRGLLGYSIATVGAFKDGNRSGLGRISAGFGFCGFGFGDGFSPTVFGFGAPKPIGFGFGFGFPSVDIQ